MLLFSWIPDGSTLSPGLFLLFLAGWVGHACIWTSLLNILYGCPIPKWILRPYRLLSGVIILGFPALLFAPHHVLFDIYELIVLGFGLVLFPVITVRRLLRPKPRALIAEQSETNDYWKELGPQLLGTGKRRLAAQLPMNCVFQVDFTHYTLAIPHLPPAWNELSILLLSDLHFCGTPTQVFFETIFARLREQPQPDLVILAGDYLDTDRHHEWIVPLLSPFKAKEGRFAILGNHDKNHAPDRVREELNSAGFTVLSNRWMQARIRGQDCVLVGHEGPWIRPAPDLSQAPPDLFRLCISHTPDNFYWGVQNQIGLMLCGHVHGGQIRIPLIGSIFVPSIYGRRFDMGIFEKSNTVMVVGRGLSGKEPLRFRCHPQVIRITLTAQ